MNCNVSNVTIHYFVFKPKNIDERIYLSCLYAARYSYYTARIFLDFQFV